MTARLFPSLFEITNVEMRVFSDMIYLLTEALLQALHPMDPLTTRNGIDQVFKDFGSLASSSPRRTLMRCVFSRWFAPVLFQPCSRHCAWAAKTSGVCSGLVRTKKNNQMLGLSLSKSRLSITTGSEEAGLEWALATMLCLAHFNSPSEDRDRSYSNLPGEKNLLKDGDDCYASGERLC